jgi:hypothetical protein
MRLLVRCLVEDRQRTAYSAGGMVEAAEGTAWAARTIAWPVPQSGTCAGQVTGVSQAGQRWLACRWPDWAATLPCVAARGPRGHPQHGAYVPLHSHTARPFP